MQGTKPEKLVLIVEDSVVTSVAVGRVIEHALEGCHIIRAQSLFEAKLLLSVYEFHLFVLDIHLPDGCGLDLLGEIVAKDPTAATIVLTADGAPENRIRSTAFGVQHFITKLGVAERVGFRFHDMDTVDGLTEGAFRDVFDVPTTIIHRDGEDVVRWAGMIPPTADIKQHLGTA